MHLFKKKSVSMSVCFSKADYKYEMMTGVHSL